MRFQAGRYTERPLVPRPRAHVACGPGAAPTGDLFDGPGSCVSPRGARRGRGLRVAAVFVIW
jgi:hypothetical protein